VSTLCENSSFLPNEVIDKRVKTRTHLPQKTPRT